MTECCSCAETQANAAFIAALRAVGTEVAE